MGQTRISINGRKFLINDIPVYADIPGSNPKVHGLLFNQRMIQGVFDDPSQRNLYNQLALRAFDPEKNTDGLIRALPEWYRWGLRAVTVCFQGGWPVGMGDVESIDNNPFRTDGMTLDPAYADRMDRVIRAADEIGMAVIVNILYWAQARKLKDARAVMNAVRTACRFLKEQKYTNVLIDVANEYDIFGNDRHPILQTDEGITALIQIAQAESGMPVGSSGTGGKIEKEPALASDFVIIHGNDLTRGKLYDMLLKQIEIAPDKPVLCNEDSPCCTRVDVCTELGVSWGYYNNYTKQIPPCFWGVTRGEDEFFARRMARTIGMPVDPLPEEEQFVLQGLLPEDAFSGGLHTMRVACEFPEKVDRVTFYRNDTKIYTSYDEPFMCFTESTWLGTPFKVIKGEVYRAEILLTDGTIKTLEQKIG